VFQERELDSEMAGKSFFFIRDRIYSVSTDNISMHGARKVTCKDN
jgi:hypothetical protein